MKTKVEVRGIDDINALLGTVAPREASNIMRATVHGIAGTIRDDAKKDAPEDEGDLVANIKAKRRKVRRGLIRSDVIVGLRAFYWRFLEYGQGPDGVEHAFFASAVERFRLRMADVLSTQFGKKWEAAMKRAAKRRGG